MEKFLFFLGIALIISSITMSSLKHQNSTVSAQELNELQNKKINNISNITKLNTSDEANYCYDTDNGVNVNARGTLQGSFDYELYIHKDFCLDDKTVVEYYCHNLRAATINVECSPDKICTNGLCKLSTTKIDNTCGDNIIEFGEVCDSQTIDNVTCEKLGFKSGTVKCNENCSGYDTSECSNIEQDVCGNGIVENEEHCDGENLNGKSCISLGFDTGILYCRSDCTFNADDCQFTKSETVCGNNILESGEDCDRSIIPKKCSDLGYDVGSVKCTNDCKFNVSSCIKYSNSCYDSDLGINFITPGFIYGEFEGNFFNISDICEDNVLQEYSCEDNKKYVTNFTCTLNNSICYNGECLKEIELCGNNKIEFSEECDTNKFNGETCITKGFDGGQLICSSTCKISTSSCYSNECTSASDCNDHDASTMDFCTGVPKECINNPITDCISYDGYCSAVCDAQTDSDCN